MTPWEYLFVNVVTRYSTHIQQVFVNGALSQFPQGDGPIIFEFFNGLGRDCWELVGFEDGHTYVFKRPTQIDDKRAPQASEQAAVVGNPTP